MAPPVGFKHSPETLERMRISHAAKPHPMLGKRHSQKSIEKMSTAHKGKLVGASHPMFGKHHTEESLKKMRRAHGKGENNPLFGTKRPEGVIKKIKQSKLGHTVDQLTRDKIAKTIHDKLPEYRNKLIATWNDPEKRKRRLEAMNTLEYKEKISQSVRNRWKDSSGYRDRMSGTNSPNWNGGSSFEPYCFKFNNEFKERVRAFFSYQCLECGTPQNGTKLGIHHVNFNKQTCCDDSIPLFVPLCQSCHAKTSSANKTSRDHWRKYFINVIITYYNGKCYFTKDEYREIVNAKL